jgi:hypothetical protein
MPLPASGFFNPQRQLGFLGRRAVSALDATTGGQAVLKHARSAMNFRGRGMGRASDLDGLTGAGVRGVRSRLNSRTRVDINSMNNRNAPSQLRVTGYDPRGQAQGRYGRVGLPGSALNLEDSQHVIRNRNRRVFGYGALGAGAGVGNASMNRQSGTYKGPGPSLRTAKGVGRNA